MQRPAAGMQASAVKVASHCWLAAVVPRTAAQLAAPASTVAPYVARSEAEPRSAFGVP